MVNHILTLSVPLSIGALETLCDIDLSCYHMKPRAGTSSGIVHLVRRSGVSPQEMPPPTGGHQWEVQVTETLAWQPLPSSISRSIEMAYQRGDTPTTPFQISGGHVDFGSGHFVSVVDQSFHRLRRVAAAALTPAELPARAVPPPPPAASWEYLAGDRGNEFWRAYDDQEKIEQCYRNNLPGCRLEVARPGQAPLWLEIEFKRMVQVTSTGTRRVRRMIAPPQGYPGTTRGAEGIRSGY